MKSTYIGLPELKRRAELAIREALEEAGDAFHEEVVADAPEKSGAMIESIEISPVIHRGNRYSRKLIVGKYYGRWQEQKTWYHHAIGRTHFVRDPLIMSVARLRSALAAAARRAF